MIPTQPHNRLKRLLGAGETAVGLSCALGSAQIAEEFAMADFDFIYIDQQHGLTSQDTLLGMLRAICRSDTTPLVRVPRNDSALIGQALDAGAEGVIIPMVENAEDARRAVEACRYFPQGRRSWGPLRAHHGLGTDPQTVNQEILCLVMIESAEGLRNVRDIVATPGIDGVYIGPADLGISLGHEPLSMEQTIDEGQLAAIHQIRQACTDAGCIVGISGNPQWLSDQGFRMITAGMDVSLLRSALGQVRRLSPATA